MLEYLCQFIMSHLQKCCFSPYPWFLVHWSKTKTQRNKAPKAHKTSSVIHLQPICTPCLHCCLPWTTNVLPCLLPHASVSATCLMIPSLAIAVVLLSCTVTAATAQLSYRNDFILTTKHILWPNFLSSSVCLSPLLWRITVPGVSPLHPTIFSRALCRQFQFPPPPASTQFQPQSALQWVVCGKTESSWQMEFL